MLLAALSAGRSRQVVTEVRRCSGFLAWKNHTLVLIAPFYSPAVSPVSPFPEPAGINEAEKYAGLRGSLEDYGSYIVSCESSPISAKSAPAPSC